MRRIGNIKSLTEEKDQLIVQIYLDPDLVWFEGHFPGQKILPGVVQISWALEFAKRFVPGAEIKETPLIKFSKPLVPEDLVTLKLAYVPEKKTVRFSYTVERPGEEVSTASEGRFLLC